MMRRPIARAARPGPNLIGAAATTAVVAGTATAVSGRVAHKQQAKAADAAQQAAALPAAAAEAAPPPVTSALTAEAIEKLQQLAALKDQGILTDEEFAAQKAKVLGP